MNSKVYKVVLSNIRHDLTNPINAILGYSELIIDIIGNEFFEDYLGSAGRNAFEKSKKYEKILTKNHVKKAFAYAVGDRQMDIDAANNIGIGSIGVSWWENKTLKNCDLAPSKPDELFNYLRAYTEKELGDRLIVCRAPYPTINGIQYYYAFICLDCKRVYQRDEMLKKYRKELSLLRDLEIENQGHSANVSLDNYIYREYGCRLNEGPGWLLGGRKGWFTQNPGSINFYCLNCKS